MKCRKKTGACWTHNTLDSGRVCKSDIARGDRNSSSSRSGCVGWRAVGDTGRAALLFLYRHKRNRWLKGSHHASIFTPTVPRHGLAVAVAAAVEARLRHYVICVCFFQTLSLSHSLPRPLSITRRCTLPVKFPLCMCIRGKIGVHFLKPDKYADRASCPLLFIGFQSNVHFSPIRKSLLSLRFLLNVFSLYFD